MASDRNNVKKEAPEDQQQNMSATATIKTPPPLDKELSNIENNLELTALGELGEGVFTNTRPLWHPPGARGIYGGSVIAQCLAAAQKTVPADFKVHSMHCYFVLAGNSSIPIVYHVDPVRSGRSFATRTVKAHQKGKCIFTTTCSFTKSAKSQYPDETDEYIKSRSAEHEVKFPEGIPKPEECPTDQQRTDYLLKEGKIDAETAEFLKRRADNDPFEWRRVGIATDDPALDPLDLKCPPQKKKLRQWVRAKGNIKHLSSHLPALAYCTDAWFIGTVTRVNHKARRGQVGMMVSLDHTVYFHKGDEIKTDEWMLMETESPWAGEERGLVTQRIWNLEGKLVATCFQEGLVRLRDGREGAGGDAESKL
ncbi:acyl-CoA thioesterase [Rhizina undulata]